MSIQINVADKRASVAGSPVIVCGNRGYTIDFTFDDEWTQGGIKTVRFVYLKNGAVDYIDVVMENDTVEAPILSNTEEVRVGVFEGDLRTTTPAVIPCELSIRCRTGAPVDPTPSQYDQIMALLSNVPTGGGGVHATPQDYGAVGDGVADDTAAFQMALAANREVYVPEGKYKLSDELMVYENCCLELSQAAVLNFTQTSKNCITLLRLAHLKGNHATIFVPYTFNAIVINCDTREDENRLDPDDAANSNAPIVPPFKKWDPQWKMSRYITDINICKPADTGVTWTSNEHESLDGTCYGTALYLGCHKQKDIVKFMWGVSVSGLRIAGGFKHGIHMFCTPTDNGEYWNHDMRIEAVIEACETGVLVENTFFSRLAVTFQPRLADNGTAYAKHGFKLVNAKGTDLTSSRVWDWVNRSMWQYGNEHQHIAMYGDCRGLILDDFLYNEASSYDIRDLIYTDTQSNLESMTILQEPITRWFKPVDGEPYFHDGTTEKKLLTDGALDPYFQVDSVKGYTDVLASATDTDGSTVFNEIGYMPGYRFSSLGTGNTLTESIYYMTTGFIAVKPGDTIYTEDLRYSDTSMTYAGIVYYDSTRTRIASLAIGNVVNGNENLCTGYTETDEGCSFTFPNNASLNNLGLAYARFVFPTSGVGANPAIAVNQEIKETVAGFLSDGVKVKAENVVYLGSAIDARLKELGLID